ncbi:SOS response-associated peptidase family protein [Microbacterium sp. YY-01]|uniref:SOS response-associated peptidase family protein n=1 Tax=Microbacterium sp. YY-01 TaxID=3421634 RepID=UPI003D186F49
MLAGLHHWATNNNNEVLKPTGRHRRNLNPLIPSTSALEEAWWGYLVNGAPAPFASINTRSERLETARSALPQRALVPATFWREMQKPARIWHNFGFADAELFTLAAVVRTGTTPEGHPVTCYSIVMHDAPEHLQNIHHRMPLLVPPHFIDEWLLSTAPAAELIGAARDASLTAAADVAARPDRPGPGSSRIDAAPTLF